MPVALFVSVFLIAACGLIYELIAGTLASYLLGDNVFQFSTIIGCYLFAMGIGSYLSRFLRRGLVAQFVSIELMVGVVGGFSSSLLFLAFAYTEAFRLVLYVVVILVGTLVGLEIPLLMRILKERFQFRDLISHVLTFDYLGALGASLLFPILLVPKLGLVRSALVFGILNAGVALWSTFFFRAQLARGHVLRIGCFVALALLGGGMVFADRISSSADNNLYADEVIFSRNTRYQHIVLTKWKDDLRLFLNTHLQFSSRDEYRYHEALVHPGSGGIARRAPRAGDGRRRRPGHSRNLEVSERRKHHAGRSRSGNDQAVFHASGARGAQPACLHRAARPRHQRRCLSMARPELRPVRFYRGGFSRSHQLFARQAFHDYVLSAGCQAPLGRRPDSGAKHLAVFSLASRIGASWKR